MRLVGVKGVPRTLFARAVCLIIRRVIWSFLLFRRELLLALAGMDRVSPNPFRFRESYLCSAGHCRFRCDLTDRSVCAFERTRYCHFYQRRNPNETCWGSIHSAGCWWFGDCFQSIETSKSMTRKLAVLTRKWGLILTGLVPSSKLRANTLQPLVKLTANSTLNKRFGLRLFERSAII